MAKQNSGIAQKANGRWSTQLDQWLSVRKKSAADLAGMCGVNQLQSGVGASRASFLGIEFP